MPSTTSVLSTYTTLSGSALLVQSMLNEVQSITNQLIPQQLQQESFQELGAFLGITLLK
ncbi:hypothetical protein AAG906_003993 [Vitis piasezkii]